MAAPSGTVWGEIVNGNSGNPSGRKGRIGIYTNVSNTNEQTTVNVQVWFWSIYSCSDGASNTLYYDCGTGVSSASTSVKSNIKINHTVASGSGWSASNQTKLLDKTTTYDRGSSDKKYKVYAKFSGIDMMSGPAYANTTFTVPAKPSYTVKFDANGGTGAPGDQKKLYDETLKLSTKEPTRDGYTFSGWGTSKTATSAKYSPGGNYESNASITLYAVWKTVTYTIKYDANGGTGAPGSQTKSWGVTLKLTSSTPSRENYSFLGWSTSSTATTATYSPGSNYTANASATLYAVWKLSHKKPRITGVSLYRCVEDGTADDSGTYARAIFDWATDQEVTSIVIEHFTKDSDVITTTIYPSEPESGTGTGTETEQEPESRTEGHVDVIIGSGDLSIDKTYTVKITVEDAVDYYTLVRTIDGYKFIRDFYAKGEGVAWGKPAELKDVFDIGFQTRLLGGLLYPVLTPETDLNDVRAPGFYVGENVSTYDYVNCPLTSGTFTLEVLSGGIDGQTFQRLSKCSKNEPQVFERTYYGGEWSSWTGDWIIADLSVSKLFSVYADNNRYLPKYRKDGRIVEIRGIVTPAADIEYSDTHVDIFTVPSGYRPDMPLYVLCQGSGTCTWLLRVNTDGKVGFARYRNADTGITAKNGYWLPFQITYFAK
jgi:uncharacterized repeat protein (TIGR02543 family)